MQIIFLETLCNDQRIIERNIRLKIQQSPDYADEYVSQALNSFSLEFSLFLFWNTVSVFFPSCRPDFEAGYRDFKARLDNYEKVVLLDIIIFLVMLKNLNFLLCQVYEPVEEGSYIKMIDMVSGHGGQIQVSLALL